MTLKVEEYDNGGEIFATVVTSTFSLLICEKCGVIEDLPADQEFHLLRVLDEHDLKHESSQA